MDCVVPLVSENEAPKKPSLDEVLAYARGNIRKAIIEHASHLPPEIQEEAAAEANFKLIEAYSRFENEGWRSFVYMKCHGAVQDYVKLGKGFKEQSKRSLRASSGGAKTPRLFERVELLNDNHEHDVDLVVGLNGGGSFSHDDIDTDRINWELVARMARKDDCIHAMGMWLRGFEPAEIGTVLCVCAARVGQLIREFAERVDDPSRADDPWTTLMIYAFGLSRRLCINAEEREFLARYKLASYIPVDLDKIEPKYDVQVEDQLSLFESIVNAG